MTFTTFLKEFAEGLREIEKGLQFGGCYEDSLDRVKRNAKQETIEEIASLVERMYEDNLGKW